MSVRVIICYALVKRIIVPRTEWSFVINNIPRLKQEKVMSVRVILCFTLVKRKIVSRTKWITLFNSCPSFCVVKPT